MKDFAESFWKATPPGRLVYIAITVSGLSLIGLLFYMALGQYLASSVYEVIPRLDARIEVMAFAGVWAAMTVAFLAIMVVIAAIWSIFKYRS